MDYNDLLYEKMKREYDAFISELKFLPLEEIIEKSYEKVMKENILYACEDEELLQPQAKALYHLRNPLDDLYQEWLKTEDSMMEDLRYSIRYRADSAVKEVVNRNKDCR